MGIEVGNFLESPKDAFAQKIDSEELPWFGMLSSGFNHDINRRKSDIVAKLPSFNESYHSSNLTSNTSDLQAKPKYEHKTITNRYKKENNETKIDAPVFGSFSPDDAFLCQPSQSKSKEKQAKKIAWDDDELLFAVAENN